MRGFDWSCRMGPLAALLICALLVKIYFESRVLARRDEMVAERLVPDNTSDLVVHWPPPPLPPVVSPSPPGQQTFTDTFIARSDSESAPDAFLPNHVPQILR
jgi:hypothetical protein